MNNAHHKKQIWIGVGLALLATIIWAGNFIIARGVRKEIPPVALAFYRWLTATIVILPFAWKYFIAEIGIIKQRPLFFLLTAATGVSMYNTFIYIAGHFSSAINMAILCTCSIPIISVILARIFLGEKIPPLRIIGMLVSLAGIVVLLSHGKLDDLLHFKFTDGDWWILTAAFTFSVYNTLVKKKPAGIHHINFLFVIFLLGIIILVPFYVYELNHVGGFVINFSHIAEILYIGVGASVICFIIWNKAIGALGAGRTALFGNLIPVFSSAEAVFVLNESISTIQILSFLLVVAGLVIATIRK